MAGKANERSGKRAGGLGRGLEALFADQTSISENTTDVVSDSGQSENIIIYIDINDIRPNKNQPRKVFREESIADLADSILEHGIIQPLVVRKGKTGYEIVAGERRWRAARKAKLSRVPCIVRSFTDEENALVAIIENMQREDLNPIEEAEGLQQMISIYGLTQDQVSKSVSKSRPYIANALRLLKLPSDIQNMVTEGVLTTGHARALVSVKNKTKQQAICKKIVEEGLSVRDTENLVSEKPRTNRKPLKRVKSPDTLAVEDELADIFGTRVNIRQKGNKGAIELEFFSTEELNDIIDMLKTLK